jgi:hypothetical protein
MINCVLVTSILLLKLTCGIRARYVRLEPRIVFLNLRYVLSRDLIICIKIERPFFSGTYTEIPPSRKNLKVLSSFGGIKKLI